MIFITGATGFLGSHLLHELVMHEYPVRALYRNPEKLSFVKEIFHNYNPDHARFMDKIEWVRGDILDYYSLMEHLDGVSHVFHCSGMISFNQADRQKMFDINFRGTAHIVNACLERNISRLCHVSSISAFGDPADGQPIDEDMLWNLGATASPYSFSKFRGEMEVWRGIHEGLSAVIVNPSVIVGPGMWHTVTNLHQLIRKGLRYYPTGSSGYVDVRDVVRIMVMLAHHEIQGERFIISAENLEHREFIRYIAESTQSPVPLRPLTPLLMRTLCRLEKLRSLVSGDPPRITTRSMKSAAAITSYSNRKLQNLLPVEFIPVKESVAYSTHFYGPEYQSDKV